MSVLEGYVFSLRIVQVPMGRLPAGDIATVSATEFARDSREVTDDLGRDLWTGVEGYQ
jgi:hypothetical protein